MGSLREFFCKHEFEHIETITHINIEWLYSHRIPRDEWDKYPEYSEAIYICKKCGQVKRVKI